MPLQDTGERTFSDGKIFKMPLREDQFLHFTLEDRVFGILQAGKLLFRPPYSKFGADAVFAVSRTYGKFQPKVQTTHYRSTNLQGILFHTPTMPERGYIEEVSWDKDVVLLQPKVLAYKEALQLLQSPKVRITGDDMVLYE